MTRKSHNNAAGSKKSRTVPGCRRSSKCRSTYACRKVVYMSKDPSLRAGRLHKHQLTKNRVGKIVSRKKSFDEKRKYRTDPQHPLRLRNDIVKNALARMEHGSSYDEYEDNDEFDDESDDGIDDGYDEYDERRPPIASPIASPIPEDALGAENHRDASPKRSKRSGRVINKPPRFND